MREPKLVSLFPYQIKNINNFYFRNHPKGLNPHSPAYKNYWHEFGKKAVEGVWINDEGTWVYLMPKLFTYANYVKISTEEERNFTHPRIRDNDWIIFSYIMCFDKFSGFELDEEYTCHDYIRRIELDADKKIEDSLKESLNQIELEKIPKSCYKEDGSFKKYVDPWHYLTRHYLIEHPAKKPLGQALYENVRSNGMIMSARGTGKSSDLFAGDFIHEFLFNGIKRWEDIKQVNNKLLFGMGASKDPYISKSVKMISTFYDRMPGQYIFNDPNKPKYAGPFYKRVQGTWTVGSETTHTVKYKRGKRPFIESSSVYINVLTPNNLKVGAGDRFRRIYIEEVGFIDNILEVHAANKDSLIAEGEKVGSVVYTGTGGDLNAVKQPKMMFDNPQAYHIFGIPNYWENVNKKIGLFIPIHYALKEFKDENGNTRLDLVHKHLLAKRKKEIETLDSLSYDSEISYNPMEPKEILRSNSGSVLPKREMQDQLSRLETFDIFRKRAQIGSFHYNSMAERGVEWKKDMENKLRPILDSSMEGTAGYSKEGAWIIYEQPPTYIPDGLYWVIYDPAKQSGEGDSYHSILVYKSFFQGSERTLYDTIVAEMICRKETLEENYHEVIKGARYFNAKIFPEINVAGFVHWCTDNKVWGMLESDAYLVEKEINPDGKRSYYRVGFTMDKRKKDWAMKMLRDWLLAVKENDPITGLPMIRTIDWIFSKRILNEGIEYEEGGNYDHISSLLGLMILISKLSGGDVPNLDNEEEYESPEEKWARTHLENVQKTRTNQRSAFLQY